MRNPIVTPWRVRSLVWLLALVALACDDDEELVVPPDITALVQAYETPTGAVEGEDVPCLGQAAITRIQSQQLGPLRDVLAGALETLRVRLEASDFPVDTSPPSDQDTPRLRGVVRVESICRGWDPQSTTPDQQRNGVIVLNALIEGGLRPVIWGQATNCQARAQVGNTQVNVFLNTSLVLFLYRGLRSGGETTFLVKMQGEVGNETSRQPVDVDFRASTGSLDLRLPSRAGDIIASVGNDGQVVVRTRDGNFDFDPATTTCSTP